MLTNLIGMLIIGVIVGAIARLLMPGRDPMGCLATALLGIVGSVVGGFIGGLIFGPRPGNSFLRPGFLLSIVGAMIALWVWRLIQKRSA